MKVGFIGLGRMGLPMARNLIRAGHELTAYDRTRGRAETLQREGARIANSPAEAAAEADVLVTMLANDEAVRETVLDGDEAAIRSLRREAVHMSSSTVSVEISKELEQRHRERGQGYIAATIIGRPEAAAERRLWIIAAGAPAQIERCRPVMQGIGHGITEIGEEPWRANLVKIAVNFVLGSMVEMLGESYALVEKHGIDARKFLEVLNGGALQSPFVQNYGTIIAERRYEPAGFSLRLGLKDTELALEAAESARSPLPFAAVIRDHYLQALAYGHGELDWAAVAEISRINANVVRTLKAGG